ncbi:restriction endonuclease subunit S [Porticoccaceae bacterium]|nr:restriction endonuclease subunit S [Porticoccaceae bacterium]
MSSLVPEGWQTLSLSEGIDILSGYPFASSLFTNDSSKTGLIRIRDLVNQNIETYFDGAFDDNYLIRKGDVLIGMDGDFNIVKWNSAPSLLNQRICKVTVAGKIFDLAYLYQDLQKDLLEINNQTGSTTVKHLSVKDIRGIHKSYPPLPEQKKIASILTSVDEVIENTQKQIDKLQDLKKATMNELLTKGIGHTEFKDSELGRIPNSWEVRAISEVVSIPNGQVDPKLEPYASMPHIGSGNIISWTGQVKGVQTAFEAGQISGKYLFSKNHILYSKVRPNLAKVCMPQFDGICSADVYPLIPKQKVSGKFVFQYLLTEKFTQVATEVSERTGMPKINRQDLNVLKLPMPPFEEQSEIARKIEAIDKATSLKSIKLHQTQSLKKSLMQDLLTGRVRVTVN